jgi:hypothetical protein
VKVADDKITVENVNHPGKTHRVDRIKYEAARKTMLALLPKAEPGLTQAELVAAMKAALPDDLFPGGATGGWWTKCVHLDLEAKGVMVRHGKPNRYRLA